MEHVLRTIRSYLEANSGSSESDDNIISRCLCSIKQWISSKNEFEDVKENYRFLSLKVFPMWNEVMNKNIDSPDVFWVHETVFELLSNLRSDVSGMAWLRVKWKISLKYAGKLISVKKYSRAETCLDFFEKQIREMQERIEESIHHATTSVKERSAMADTKRDLLICHLYRVEIYSAGENYPEARNSLRKVKLDFLGSFDDVSRKYTAALCFNIGLEACRREKYEESVFWLARSYEMSDSKDENQTSTLLLLAEANMMLNCKQRCEDAIAALRKVDCDNKDFNINFMKLKAYIGSDAPQDDIRRTILHCYKTAEMSENKLLQICHALQRCDQKSLLYEAMLTFESIFSLSQVSKIFELHLKMLLKENLLDEAEEVVKSYLNALSRSIQANEFPSTEEMLMLIGRQASLFAEKSAFAKAVSWFEYCIRIVPRDVENPSDLRKLKFYQQKCNCLLELGLSDEAKEMLLLAEEQMTDHIINKYLRLKLCIILNEENEAISVVESCGLHPNNLDDSDDVAKILTLCAKFGLEKQRVGTTICILENVVGKFARNTSVVAVLRCIIKLKLKSGFANKTDQDWLYGFLPKVCKCLDSISGDKDAVTNEAKWFMKVFWNVAHGEKDNPLFVHKLLDCCGKILRYCDPSDTTALVQRNSCILISVAAGLEVVRSTLKQNSNPGAVQELTKNILENINEFKGSNVRFDQELSRGFRTTQRLLLICEFEVKAILHCHDLEDVFERAVSLPDIDEKTFELLAAIACRGENHCYSLTLRSLRAAIGKLMEIEPHDYEHLSRLYHSLLCVVSAEMENNTAYKTDFGKFINEIYELIKSAPDGKFPQSELLWFVTRTWNNSIKLYLQFGRHNEALAWSQLAIGMSDHLVSLKDVYQEKMKLLYDRMSRPSPGYLDAEQN